MTTKRKKGIKKGRGKGIEIGIEKEIARRRRKKGATRFWTNLNLKDALGIKPATIFSLNN